MNIAVINSIIDYEVGASSNRCFPCRSVCTTDTHSMPPPPPPPPCTTTSSLCDLLKHSDLFTPSQQGGLCLMTTVHLYDRYAYIIHIERNL